MELLNLGKDLLYYISLFIPFRELWKISLLSKYMLSLYNDESFWVIHINFVTRSNFIFLKEYRNIKFKTCKETWRFWVLLIDIWKDIFDVKNIVNGYNEWKNSKKIITHLPIYFNRNTYNCCICMNSLFKRCSISIGKCNHIYHYHCISKWTRKRLICPIDSKKWDELYNSSECEKIKYCESNIFTKAS